MAKYNLPTDALEKVFLKVKRVIAYIEILLYSVFVFVVLAYLIGGTGISSRVYIKALCIITILSFAIGRVREFLLSQAETREREVRKVKKKYFQQLKNRKRREANDARQISKLKSKIEIQDIKQEVYGTREEELIKVLKKDIEDAEFWGSINLSVKEKVEDDYIEDEIEVAKRDVRTVDSSVAMDIFEDFDLKDYLDNELPLQPEIKPEVEETCLAAIEETEVLEVETAAEEPWKQRKKVFISYSKEDNVLYGRVRTCLKMLELGGVKIDVWDDTQIKAGDIQKEEIKKAIDTTKIALLLISIEYLGSDFIATHVLEPLLKAVEEGEVTIVPLILTRSIYSRHNKLSQYAPFNDIDKPLNTLSKADQDEVLVNLAYEVERLLGS